VSLTKEYVATLRAKYEQFKSIRIKLRKQGMANSEENEKTRQSTILKLTKQMQEIEEILGIDNRPVALGNRGWNEKNVVPPSNRFF